MKSKEYFAEHSKARYNFLKSSKRCAMCGDKDERTIAGKTRCSKCAERDKKYSRMQYRRIKHEMQSK